MPELTFTHRHKVKTLNHALTFSGSCKTFQLQGENWRCAQIFVLIYQLVCCKKAQSPTSLNIEAISYSSCTSVFILMAISKLCEHFPGFCPARLPQQHVAVIFQAVRLPLLQLQGWGSPLLSLGLTHCSVCTFRFQTIPSKIGSPESKQFSRYQGLSLCSHWAFEAPDFLKDLSGISQLN